MSHGVERERILIPCRGHVAAAAWLPRALPSPARRGTQQNEAETSESRADGDSRGPGRLCTVRPTSRPAAIGELGALVRAARGAGCAPPTRCAAHPPLAIVVAQLLPLAYPPRNPSAAICVPTHGREPPWRAERVELVAVGELRELWESELLVAVMADPLACLAICGARSERRRRRQVVE